MSVQQASSARKPNLAASLGLCGFPPDPKTPCAKKEPVPLCSIGHGGERRHLYFLSLYLPCSRAMSMPASSKWLRYRNIVRRDVAVALINCSIVAPFLSMFESC